MSALESLHKENNTELTECNGVNVPVKFNEIEVEYKALRENIILADYSHYTKIKIEGDEAFDFLDFAVAGDVADVRDEQTLYTVILDEKGDILSDVYVLNDDDTYILLCEYLDEKTLLEILEARKGEFEVEIEALSDHGIVALEGPYSWELAAEIYGMDVVGIPFLGFIALENDTWLFRGGKNGEYGYKLILPQADAVELWKKAEELGEKYNLVKAGLDVCKLGRLENPYFNPEGAGKSSRNPRELQLQWLVRYDKEEFFGRDALLENKESAITKKIVGIIAQEEDQEVGYEAGDKVFCGADEIGEVVSAGYSPSLKRFLGQAYLTPDYAYASIDAYTIKNKDGKEIKITTSSTPFFAHLSMLVDANEHSFVNTAKHKNALEQYAAENKVEA